MPILLEHTDMNLPLRYSQLTPESKAIQIYLITAKKTDPRIFIVGLPCLATCLEIINRPYSLFDLHSISDNGSNAFRRFIDHRALVN